MSASEMHLSKLSDPFQPDDVEWRVSRAGLGPRGIYCRVFAYVTARAIQQRLDDVCGPARWRTEQPRVVDIGKPAFACGLSILTDEEQWITKWDVCEPTSVEPAKGGWSGSFKRAGAQWGIARYLYYLKEIFADVQETLGENSRGWNYAKIKTDEGPRVYYWKSPSLPGWALPKEPETECSKGEVVELVAAIRAKLCPDVTNPKERQEAISRFIYSITGEFPIADYKCWTRDAHDRVAARIKATTNADGPSADVPFGGES